MLEGFCIATGISRLVGGQQVFAVGGEVDETNRIPKVTFKTDSKAVVTATTDPEKRYTLSDVFDGTRIRSVNLSPNGKYLLTALKVTFGMRFVSSGAVRYLITTS